MRLTERQISEMIEKIGDRKTGYKNIETGTNLTKEQKDKISKLAAKRIRERTIGKR